MTTTPPTVAPRDLAATHAPGRPVDLVDVRTPAEFAEMHVPFAVNVPLGRLDPTALSVTAPAGDPVYVICRSGARGRQACARLAAAGVEAVNVDGGTQAWADAGLPVVRGQKKAIALDRQVRIAAGSLVLAGLALAKLVHPGFAGLSAFIGAGLVFSGVTDTCTMAVVLAKMPWNRNPAQCAVAR